VVYYFLSLYYLPSFYLSQSFNSRLKPIPIISAVRISESQISNGKSFAVSVIGKNIGNDADVQTIEISFPNLTSSVKKTIVTILNSNFTQKPIFTSTGDILGTKYSGLKDTTIAKYPSIEFYSRPWKSKTTYQAQIEVKPPLHSIGNFMLFVKSVAFPHTTAHSHYPYSGPKDQQQEFVSIYNVRILTR
jgi:hypothetical protein